MDMEADKPNKKHLALTFIDTLLSSQRTRTHHHTPTNRRGDPGQPLQLIPNPTRTQTTRSNNVPRTGQQLYTRVPATISNSSNLVSRGPQGLRVGVRNSLTPEKLPPHTPTT